MTKTKKQTKCVCCHETETLYPVKIKKGDKEKIVGLCDICLRGLTGKLGKLTEKEKEFKNYFIRKVLKI